MPAEVRKHIRQIPVPRCRHHQNRRCREMRERAANRNINKQQTQRGVGQLATRLELIKLLRQQQRRNRHRRRLRNHGSQQRRDRQNRKPPSHWSATPQRRHQPQPLLR